MGSLSNGVHCSGVSSVTPKYKKRKVSAYRVFPPGCGPNAPRIKKAEKPVDNKTEMEVSAVLGSPPGCRPNGSKIQAEKPVDDENKMEGSAVGCGSNASRIHAEEPVDYEKKMDVSAVDGVITSENGDDEGVKSPSELEMAESLDDLVGKVVASAAEAVNGDDVASSVKPLGDDFWQTLQIDAPEFCQDFDIVEPPAVVQSKDIVETKLETEITDLPDEQGPPSNDELPLAQDFPINDGNIVKDTSMETKFRRRRVSATRVFPPFCGRNAPRPTEEERAKITLGASGKVPQQNRKLENERVKREEPEVDVKDENHKIEDVQKILHVVNSEPEYADEQGRTSMDIVMADVHASPASETRGSGFGESDGDVREIDSRKAPEIYQPKWKSESEKVYKTDFKDERDIIEDMGKEIVVYAEKSLDICYSDDYALGCGVDGTIVQGLIAGPSSPLRHDHTQDKKDENKYISKKVNNNLGGRSAKKTIPVKASLKKKPLSSAIIEVRKKGLVSQEPGEASTVGPNEIELTLPPFGPSTSSEGSMRNKVRETLRLFQAICRKLLQGEEANLKQQGKTSKRIDLEAAKIIKSRGKEINTGTQIIGAVPGVEVGDEFLYRVELALVGVHRLYQAGIDYMTSNGMIICVSIVASGGYADELDNPDLLIYSGQGGMPGGKNKEKQAEDQKLERGNLALKNSITAKNPIRVIRGTKEKVSRSDARSKMAPSYAYDGLYLVEKYWQDVGHNGKLVFKFELRRIPGQPELAWKEVKKSKKFKSREGVCIDDISNGKEEFRICAVNTVDNEKPPAFNYITKMIYPSWYSPTPPAGCNCIDGCSDSRKCSCVIRNGEEIPYNHNGAIVEAKPFVHECGPSCKCPPSCFNRVSQHGMKIQLEIFKTESRGWGVRSLSSIPSGSFICEYIGELLEDKEAEQRCNDEYLFDIGKNFADCSHQLFPQTSLAEVSEDSGFTIDAAVYGNVGRFINHSCSPNLYAQNVLYDHEDKSMPHIMLFAAENIPPLQELTYHYNYSIGQVRDSNGNVKIKNCYCGSEECTGRMY